MEAVEDCIEADDDHNSILLNLMGLKDLKDLDPAEPHNDVPFELESVWVTAFAFRKELVFVDGDDHQNDHRVDMKKRLKVLRHNDDDASFEVGNHYQIPADLYQGFYGRWKRVHI